VRGEEYERVEYTPYGEVWIERKGAVSNLDISWRFTGKERDAETGLYYYGARYLDSKTGRWLSTDPALGEYVPGAPVNGEARKRNGNLPGMGGVYNLVNLHVYHYAGNNPVKYTDPDGKAILATRNAWAMFRANGNALIGNHYNTPQYHTQEDLFSSIAYYPEFGRSPRLLTKGNNNYFTKEQLNQRALGINVSRFFINLAAQYQSALGSGDNVSFFSEEMEGKFDSGNAPYYELSMYINGNKKGILFYYSGTEGKTKDDVLRLVGDLFSTIVGGEINDWMPSGLEVNGETPF
jgi:RHS repeat-associated protein